MLLNKFFIFFLNQKFTKNTIKVDCYIFFFFFGLKLSFLFKNIIKTMFIKQSGKPILSFQSKINNFFKRILLRINLEFLLDDILIQLLYLLPDLSFI